MIRKSFITHSREDVGLVNRIYKTLTSVGIMPHIAEFEEYEEGKLTAGEIKNKIQESSEVLVFLTPNVTAKTHTQNWVAYEIGVAHALKRDVYVFEGFNQIEFPVPYLDHYILFEPNEGSHWEFIGNALQQIPEAKKDADAGPVVGALLGAPFGPLGILLGAGAGAVLTDEQRKRIEERRRELESRRITCLECRGVYHLWSNVNEFKCPICRRFISLSPPIQ